VGRCEGVNDEWSIHPPSRSITHSNIETLLRSETASYASINSRTTSSVRTKGVGGNGTSNFDIDFNKSILQVHKCSPLYIIGD